MPSFDPSFLPKRRRFVRTFTCAAANTSFVIHLYNADDKDLNKLFPVYASKLMQLIHSNTELRRSVINIEYFPLKNNKKLPSKKAETCHVDNVNTGYCYPYSSENDINIVIFRNQEFYKVFAHEMIHLYDLIPVDSVYQQQVSEMFEHKLPHLNMNESLVELLALVFNCVIISSVTDSPAARELIARELKWSIHVVDMLMRHFDLTRDKSLLQIASNWKETTHCVSYYVLKMVMLEKLCDALSIEESNEIDFGKTSCEKCINMTINDIENFKLT